MDSLLRYRLTLIREVFAQLEILLPKKILNKPLWYNKKFDELMDMKIADMEFLSKAYWEMIVAKYPGACRAAITDHAESYKYN